MVNPENLNCPKCGNPLEWADTIDTEGSIQEGYIIETQAWTCNHCEIDYVIQQKVTFSENDVDIIYFKQN